MESFSFLCFTMAFIAIFMLPYNEICIWFHKHVLCKLGYHDFCMKGWKSSLLWNEKKHLIEEGPICWFNYCVYCDKIEDKNEENYKRIN